MTFLLVVLMIAVFFLGEFIVRHREVKAAVTSRAPRPAGVRLPNGVFFAPSHTWLSLLPSGRAWVGIDDFVLRLLEHPRVRFLQPAGTRVGRGQPLLVLEDGAHRLTVQSPLEATVVSLNGALAEGAPIGPEAPFCEAWACEIEPIRPVEIKALRLGAEAAAWMREEFGRLRDVLAGAGPLPAAAVLQDGGAPVAGAMKQAPPETWARFEHEFLEVR
jgi:glycine cleavage system H lipoate-binding protein